MKETYKVDLLLNRNKLFFVILMPYRTRKWKKKEDFLLLTNTETLLAWWEEEQGEKIYFIAVSFWNVKKGLTKIFQEQITLLKVSTLRSVLR